MIRASESPTEQDNNHVFKNIAVRPQNGLAGQSDGARSACSLAHASSSPEPSHQLLEKREGQEHLG